MDKFTPLSLLILASQANTTLSLRSNSRGKNAFRGRFLSEDSIAGFVPETAVTDHNAIDLDQMVIEQEVQKENAGSFARAKDVYVNGGHSKSFAKLTLTSAQTSLGLLDKTPVIGTDVSGAQVTGKVYSSSETPADQIWVQYDTSSLQESYVGCQVGNGALVATGNHKTSGCFEASGIVTIAGVQYSYTYSPEEDNHNGRTIQGFSLSTLDKMIQPSTSCPGCPYEDASYFDNYYGTPMYVDKWVQAAFAGTPTNFPSGRGDADFSLYSFEGRAQAIQKGTAYMIIFMYVIREFDDALDDCEEKCPLEGCNDDAVHAWVEGVAFYTGSLEGKSGDGDGKFLHALADKRCVNFGTCHDDAGGKSKVNKEMLELFKKGSGELLEKRCDDARKTKDKIVDLMYIPLIQGILRYAYKVHMLQGGEKEKAEGAIFAASILPRIFAENESDAEMIYENMRVGAVSTSFSEVKEAFERNYKNLNIKCSDVGGLLDNEGNYYEGMEPCRDEKKNVVGIILGSIVGMIAFVGVGFVVRRKRARNDYVNPDMNTAEAYNDGKGEMN